MLTLNMSITFATHYCGGKPVETSISLGHDDLKCEMSAIEKKACTKSDQKQKITRKNCCNNTYTTLSVDDNYNSTESVSLNIKFVSAFIAVFIHHTFFNCERLKSFFTYSPPLLEQDKSVLFQVFRL